jgi:hypothetical protein
MTYAYLAGPMTNHPDYNRAEFDTAAQWVRDMGWKPVNPFDINASHDGDCPPGPRHRGHHNSCWYTACLKVLAAGCDLVVMLPEWRTSVGARLEHQRATELGLTIVYFGETA